MNKIEVAELLDNLAIRYPNTKPFPEGTVDVWYGDLRNVPIEVVNAVMPGVRESNPAFMPSLEQITKAIKDAIDPQVSESKAWDLVLRGCRESMDNVGYPGATKFRRLIGEWIPGEQGTAVADAAIRIGLAPILNNYERMMTPFFKALKDTQTEVKQKHDRVAIGANGSVTYPEIDE